MSIHGSKHLPPEASLRVKLRNTKLALAESDRTRALASEAFSVELSRIQATRFVNNAEPLARALEAIDDSCDYDLRNHLVIVESARKAGPSAFDLSTALDFCAWGQDTMIAWAHDMKFIVPGTVAQWLTLKDEIKKFET